MLATRTALKDYPTICAIVNTGASARFVEYAYEYEYEYNSVGA